MAANNLPTQKEILATVINEAKRIHEDALFALAGHTHEARWWDGVQLWLGIPTTVIAAITGVASLSSSPNNAATIFGVNANIVIGVLSFVVAAASGLSTFLDPKGKASKNYEAANAYASLLHEVRVFYQIDCLRSNNIDELETMLKQLGTKLKEINDRTPIISARAAGRAERSMRYGTYRYEVDKLSDAAKPM